MMVSPSPLHHASGQFIVFPVLFHIPNNLPATNLRLFGNNRKLVARLKFSSHVPFQIFLFCTFHTIGPGNVQFTEQSGPIRLHSTNHTSYRPPRILGYTRIGPKFARFPRKSGRNRRLRFGMRRLPLPGRGTDGFPRSARQCKRHDAGDRANPFDRPAASGACPTVKRCPLSPPTSINSSNVNRPN